MLAGGGALKFLVRCPRGEEKKKSHAAKAWLLVISPKLLSPPCGFSRMRLQDMAVGQNPALLVNIKIGGKWMFIHPKMEPLVMPHGLMN